MRYAKHEAPIAAAVLPAGGTVTVQVLAQETGTLLPLSSALATQTPMLLGGGRAVWQWSLANISVPIDGMLQLVIGFVHSSGDDDVSKLVVRGYVDEVTRTRKLVTTLL